MFNTLGGRNLLVARSYATGATVGQEAVPLPGGYYWPASDYNWYSYAGSDPVNARDTNGYFSLAKAINKLWAAHDALIVAAAGVCFGIALMAIGVGAVIELGPLGLVAAIPLVPTGAFLVYEGVTLGWAVWKEASG